MANEDAVRQGVENAFCWVADRARDLVLMLECELTRPSVVFRPTVAPDGNQWCALYGPNIMEGVCAFGDTPDAAMRAFDEAWAHGHTAAFKETDDA